SEWTNSGLPIIRIQNLTNQDKPYNHYSGDYDPQIRVTQGDVLISWSGTPGSSFGAFLWNRGEALLNQHIFRVVYDPKRLFSSYLVHAVNRRLEVLIQGSRGGVGLKHFTKGQLQELSIPIPFFEEPNESLKVQAAIVTKLERLKNSISEGQLTAKGM